VPVAIRPYRDEDRAAVARLWLESWRSTGLPVARLITEAGNYDRIRRELAAGWHMHLAWDTDRLLGFLALKPATQCLDQLFIAPEAQGTGIGRRLLYLAKERLPNGLWLRTSADNHRARRFYERNGWRASETQPHSRWVTRQSSTAGRKAYRAAHRERAGFARPVSVQSAVCSSCIREPVIFAGRPTISGPRPYRRMSSGSTCCSPVPTRPPSSSVPPG
jgi:putative acetyltransferase